MFDDVFSMAEQCTETFRNGVNDKLGAAIVAEVLDPIRKEIGLLRSFHEEFQRQSLNLDQILHEARSFHLHEGSKE